MVYCDADRYRNNGEETRVLAQKASESKMRNQYKCPRAESSPTVSLPELLHSEDDVSPLQMPITQYKVKKECYNIPTRERSE